MAASSSTPNGWSKVARTTKVKKRILLKKLKGWNVARVAYLMPRPSLEMQGCPFVSRRIRFRRFFFLSSHNRLFVSCSLFMRRTVPLRPDLGKPTADRSPASAGNRSKSHSFRYCCCLWHECDHLEMFRRARRYRPACPSALRRRRGDNDGGKHKTLYDFWPTASAHEAILVKRCVKTWYTWRRH